VVAGFPQTSHGINDRVFLARISITFFFAGTSRSEITFNTSSVVEPKSYSVECLDLFPFVAALSFALRCHSLLAGFQVPAHACLTKLFMAKGTRSL
jgi:hypothetical protein